MSKATPVLPILVTLVASFGFRALLGPAETAEAGPAAAAAPAIEPKADELLRRTSARLRMMSSFSFDADHTTQVVLRSGQKLDLAAASHVSVHRPDRLRSDRSDEEADLSFYYDGKSFGLLGHTTNLYATAPAPPTLDAAIDYARDRLGLEAPGSDLLYSDPYRALMEDVTGGVYLGKSEIEGVSCHHLAFEGQKVDWQLWVEESPRSLPCRYSITSKDQRAAPEFTVTFRNWVVGDRLPDQTFAMQVPEGAERIEFLGLTHRTTQAPAPTPAPAQAQGQAQGQAQPQAPAQGQAPAQLQGPALVEVPAQPQAPAQVEAPAQLPAPPQAPAQLQAPGQPQAPALVEAPAQLQAPAQAQAPAQVQAPPQVQAPQQVQTPAQVQAPQQVQTPAQVQAPQQVQTPAQVQAPQQVQTPAQVQAPQQVQTPVQVPPPTQVQTPVQLQAPPQVSPPTPGPPPAPAPTTAQAQARAQAQAPAEVQVPAEVTASAQAPAQSPTPSPMPDEIATQPPAELLTQPPATNPATDRKGGQQ